MLSLGLLACEQRDSNPQIETDIAARAADNASEYDLDLLVRDAKWSEGKRLFMQCRGCHSTQAGASTESGPNLYGVFGRRVASAPGFRFSDALRAQTFVWTPQQLDRWLRDGSAFLPSTRMRFATIERPEERAALIRYLIDSVDSAAAGE
jgi:cytochrome c